MQWLKDAWAKVKKWWKRLWRKTLGPVTNVKVNIMAKNVTIAWQLPTTRRDGGAVTPADIDFTAVEMSADAGANFTEISRVGPQDPQEVFIPDLEVGSWQFRITPVEPNGTPGAQHVEIVDVVDDSPLSAVTNVTVTQE